MKAQFAFVASLLLVPVCSAQDPARYKELTVKANSLYEQKDFKGSAETYSAAFEALGWKGYSNDRYNAACSWSLAGVPDSAFFHLFRIAEKMDYANLGHIQRDSDLKTLYDDARWPQLIDLVKANKEQLEANLDKPLAALLDSIYNEDQALRIQVDEVEQKFGRDSDEMKAHWRMIQQKDSTNLLAITKILDERGWLGPDIVGATGSSTLFLVIQHADLPIQEKYLPMMRDAVTKGNAKGSSLALLEDRVLMRNASARYIAARSGATRRPGNTS